MATRSDELRSLALRLGAERSPYYLHRPRGTGEPAPGWYWQPAGAEHPQYIAASFPEAYVKLREQLDAHEAAAKRSAAA